MKPWEKFIEKNELGVGPAKAYTKLRKLFQKYDWSESDLAKPPFYSGEMMLLKDELTKQIMDIEITLVTYGFEYEDKKLTDYFRNIFSKIDELTPLKDGNNKRRNKRDKDSE
jgi:hypothetical protein